MSGISGGGKVGNPLKTVAGMMVGVAVGCALTVPYALFCRAAVLSFFLALYNMAIGGASGAAFAFAASRQRSDVHLVVLIAGGFVVGGAMILAGQAIVHGMRACPNLFVSPILLPMFGGFGAILYVACERGFRGKRDRARERRYGASIAQHAEAAEERGE
jgi:hypothetical protein